MPVRIYDIAKRLGLESKIVLLKAKELGIAAAKVPSSSLDKITAEYLEEKLGGAKIPAAPAPQPNQPIVVVGETPTAPLPGEAASPAAILETTAPTETVTAAPPDEAVLPAIEVSEAPDELAVPEAKVPE